MTKKVSTFKNSDDRAALESIPTVSGKIRFLRSKEYDKADISRLLGIRYQHVRNVLLQPLKKQ